MSQQIFFWNPVKVDDVPHYFFSPRVASGKHFRFVNQRSNVVYRLHVKSPSIYLHDLNIEHRLSDRIPDIAKQARVQGVVILECTISPQGKVTDVKVLRGIPLLDQAATDAVRQWVYTPTLLNGVPVPVIMTVTVNFKLS